MPGQFLVGNSSLTQLDVKTATVLLHWHIRSHAVHSEAFEKHAIEKPKPTTCDPSLLAYVKCGSVQGRGSMLYLSLSSFQPYATPKSRLTPQFEL